MASQMIRLLVAVCAFAVGAVAGAQPVVPRATASLSRAQLGQVPNISDTLTVAKSPFEPVTLAISNLNSPPQSSHDVDVEANDELVFAVDIKRTTRAIQEESELEQTQNSMGSSEQQPSSSTTEASTITPAPAEVDVTAAGAEAENESTTVAKSVDLQPSEDKTTTTTTTSSPAVDSTSTSSSSSDLAGESTSGDSNSNESAATFAPELNLTPESSSESSSEKSATSSSTTDISATEAPITSAPVRESSEQETSTSNPATTTTTTTKAPVSSPEPAAEENATSVATPATTTTEAPTSVSTTNLKPEDQKVGNKTENGETEANGDEVKSSQACNHLPSYDTDEIQKVFREETTFKNGTIRGKFTYINFDQRYRLVHYTRLPYGPVKIDLVEELGKPENSNQNNRNNQSQLTPMSAIPNAVLQLRNILPNSLFGFPFLGPQTGSGSGGVARQQPGVAGDDDKSNTYFYTTDTISTPNLLSPSVPVSVPPSGVGQRQPSLDSVAPRNSITHDDGQQYEQQNSADVLAALHKYRQQERANGEAMANMFGVPNHQQFQYAVSQPQGVQSPDPKQPGLIYSYLAQPQYQYSSQPAQLYSFQQPTAYYPPRPQQVQTSSYAVSVNHGQYQHHHHQPHSHEHYLAPFMFAQPPSASGSEHQAEPAKVKLVKVKTSKALNDGAHQEPIGKSAQLRTNPSSNQGSYSAPANSPAHVGRRQYQFRHRHGKQNPDLKQTVNTTPVVYHVLRSPMGRMYNLPQYQQQTHAIAYDHDN